MEGKRLRRLQGFSVPHAASSSSCSFHSWPARVTHCSGFPGCLAFSTKPKSILGKQKPTDHLASAPGVLKPHRSSNSCPCSPCLHHSPPSIPSVCEVLLQLVTSLPLSICFPEKPSLVAPSHPGGGGGVPFPCHVPCSSYSSSSITFQLGCELPAARNHAPILSGFASPVPTREGT